MGKIQVPKKIRTEDFKSDQQDLAGKLAFIYNDNVDTVYQTLTKGINYENLNRQLVTLVINIDKTGKVTQSPEIKLNVNGKVIGVQVMNAVNINNVSTYPASAPFVSWTVNSNVLRILNITGLTPATPAPSQWQLTLDIIV